MPSQPRVTAILPCFNHARYLDQRISSVLSQTVTIDQIIFLDDASTDGSDYHGKKLLQAFTGRLDFCFNSVNSGSPFRQWNKGVSLAKNDIVWIAETDDSCDSRLIEVLCEKMLLSDVVLAFASSIAIDDEGCVIPSPDGDMNYNTSLYTNDFCIDGTVFRDQHMSSKNPIINASSVLFRRDAFLRAGMANETMRYCGDWDLWWRILGYGRIAFSSQSLNFFRTHSNSTRRIGGVAEIYAAELIACDLSFSLDLLGNKSWFSSLLHSFHLLRLLSSTTSRSLLFNALQCVQPSSLNKVAKAHAKLLGTPSISRLEWLIILIFYRFRHCGLAIKSYVKKIL